MSKPQSDHPFRVVTPKQYSDGYIELNGIVAERRSFSKIKTLDDGNYLVKEPSYVDLDDEQRLRAKQLIEERFK